MEGINIGNSSICDDYSNRANNYYRVIADCVSGNPISGLTTADRDTDLDRNKSKEITEKEKSSGCDGAKILTPSDSPCSIGAQEKALEERIIGK